jgi:hypothetical protein
METLKRKPAENTEALGVCSRIEHAVPVFTGEFSNETPTRVDGEFLDCDHVCIERAKRFGQCLRFRVPIVQVRCRDPQGPTTRHSLWRQLRSVLHAEDEQRHEKYRNQLPSPKENSDSEQEREGEEERPPDQISELEGPPTAERRQAREIPSGDRCRVGDEEYPLAVAHSDLPATVPLAQMSRYVLWSHASDSCDVRLIAKG